MKAVIMAGGEGSRLRPLTCDKPKPMMPLFSRPLMEYIIALLKQNGIEKIAVTLAYMPEKIMEHFGDGSSYGVELEYFVEKTPLGTAGSVKNAQAYLDEDFVVISGDALCDIDLKKAITFHNTCKSEATLLLSRVEEPLEYGVVVCANDGAVIRFIEKPGWSQVYCDTVNTGIYIMNKDILSLIPQGRQFDFSRDLFPKMLELKIPMYGLADPGYWCDIGDTSAYLNCHLDVLDGRVKGMLFDQLKNAKPSAFDGVKIIEPSYISPSAVISSGCRVGPYAVIGDDCTLEAGSSISKSILHQRCFVGSGCELRGTILSDDVKLSSNTRCFEGSVIGTKTLVSQGATIRPCVRIWPFKSIEEGSDVKKNVVWGAKGADYEFNDGSITGEFNNDISVELAARIGSAAGSMFVKKAILIADDGTPPAMLLKTALACGMASCGSEVIDANKASKGSAIYGALTSGIPFIAYVSSINERITISFFDRRGVLIPTPIARRLQGALMRDDHIRSRSEDILKIEEASGFDTRHVKWLLSCLPPFNDVSLNIVHDSSPEGQLIITLLNKAGCRVYLNEEKGHACIKYTNGLELIDEDGRRIFGEQLYTLLFKLYISFFPSSAVAVPLWVPNAVLSIARESNVDIIINTSDGLVDDPKAIEAFRFLNDPVASAAMVACALSGGKRLRDIYDAVPKVLMKKREAYCKRSSKGRVMRELSNELSPADMCEGIRIEKDGGYVLIVPSSFKPSCSIYTDCFDEETATELCDFYERKIRELDSSSDFN